jgi:dihydroxy-acid dehydratase
MTARLDDPNLDIDENCAIVLQSAGPQGAPGHAEWGQLPIPQKLLKKGIRDMLRISDARMSGTSYGACVLHVTPESHVGGPLALVRDGDRISIDIEARRLDLQVSDEELAKRKGRLEGSGPRNSRAVTACCTSSTSSRPTRAAISISSSPSTWLRAQPASRKFH